MGFSLKIGLLIYLLTFFISLMVVGVIVLVRKASRLETQKN